MRLRKYIPEDLPQIARLFYDTIHQVNCRDYAPEQIEVWAGSRDRLLAQNDFFESLYTLVALDGQTVACYGNIGSDGYLDHLYVHKDYQGKGVATALCDALEQYAASQGATCITVHASITAQPFFLHRGYRTMHSQQVLRQGVALTNNIMQKEL